MVRTQIQLTEEQVKKLKSLAAESGVSMAELIRTSIDKYLEDINHEPRKKLVEKAKEAAGKYTSAPPDLAVNHDRYLAEDYKS